MAYIDQENLANDPTFRGRVAFSIIKAAIAIKNEAPSTPGHIQRAGFAGTVLNNPSAALNLAQGVATQPPFQDAATVVTKDPNTGVTTTTVTTAALDSDIDN